MLTGTAAAGQDRIVLDSSSMDIVPTVGSRTAAFLLEEGYDLSLRSEVLALDS